MLTTSPHYFYKKHMNTRKENLYFDIGDKRLSFEVAGFTGKVGGPKLKLKAPVSRPVNKKC